MVSLLGFVVRGCRNGAPLRLFFLVLGDRPTPIYHILTQSTPIFSLLPASIVHPPPSSVLPDLYARLGVSPDRHARKSMAAHAPRRQARQTGHQQRPRLRHIRRHAPRTRPHGRSRRPRRARRARGGGDEGGGGRGEHRHGGGGDGAPPRAQHPRRLLLLQRRRRAGQLCAGSHARPTVHGDPPRPRPHSRGAGGRDARGRPPPPVAAPSARGDVRGPVRTDGATPWHHTAPDTRVSDTAGNAIYVLN